MPSPYEQKSKRKLITKNILFSLLMLLILLLTFHFLSKGVSLATVWRSLMAAKLEWLLLGFGLMFIHQLCVAEIMRLLITKVLGLRLARGLCLKTSYIGFYFNNITPSATGGQPMQIYYLYQSGIQIAGSSMIFLAMTMYYNLLMLILASVMLCWQSALILPQLYAVKYLLIYGYLFNGGLLLISFFLIYKPALLAQFCAQLIRLAKRWHLLKDEGKWQVKAEKFFASYTAHSNALWRSYPLLLRLFVIQLVEIVALYLVPYTAGRALGASAETLLPTFAIQSVLYLAVAGVPTPGSVGISESAFVSMYAQVFPQEQVFSVMLLTRVINLYLFLLLAALISLYAFSQAGRNKQHVS